MHKPGVCRNPKLYLGLTIVFVVLFIVSLVLAFKVFPDVIESEVDKSVRLEKGTEQWDRFIELPFPVDFKVYIFEVTNKNQLLNGEMPELKETGPFVYSQNRKKTVLSTSSSDDTVSYRQRETFKFEPEQSGGLSDEQIVTVLNPPYMSMLQKAEDVQPVTMPVLASCMDEWFPGYGSLFIDIKVKDLLFDGLKFMVAPVEPPLWCQIAYDTAYDMATDGSIRNVDKLEAEHAASFSYFNYKVRSDDGLYTVKRGMDDIETLGHITKLNDRTHMEIWGGPNSTSTCDEVKGTDSTLYPPRIEDDTIFQIFSTDICRYVNIYYKEEATYKDIDGYKFGTTEETLKSKAPQDDCFCANRTSNPDGIKSCFLDGVIDMFPCLGVNVLLSFPHFLWADDSYKNGVVGVKPDVSKHETYLIVEPNTGTPLQGVKRIQMNAVLRPIDNVPVTSKLPRTVLPLLWLEEGVSLTEKYIDELNEKYFSKKSLVDGIQWSLVGITSALSIIFCGIFIKLQFFSS